MPDIYVMKTPARHADPYEWLKWFAVTARQFEEALRLPGPIAVDLSRLTFVNPFSACSLAALLHSVSELDRLEEITRASHSCQLYFAYIGFPGGIVPVKRSRYASKFKRYSPIFRWHANSNDEVNIISSIFRTHAMDGMGASSTTTQSVAYTLSELWDKHADSAG